MDENTAEIPAELTVKKRVPVSEAHVKRMTERLLKAGMPVSFSFKQGENGIEVTFVPNYDGLRTIDGNKYTAGYAGCITNEKNGTEVTMDLSFFLRNPYKWEYELPENVDVMEETRIAEVVFSENRKRLSDPYFLEVYNGSVRENLDDWMKEVMKKTLKIQREGE